MRKTIDDLALKGMHLLEPENANKIGLKLLNTRALIPGIENRPITNPFEDPIELMGMKFINRIGIAAGLDKDGAAISGLVSLGVGSIELGGVTPRAQKGNDKKNGRIKRITSSAAMINRLGFNNLGSRHLATQIRKFRQEYKRRHGSECQTIIGVNIGKNWDTPIENAEIDYKQVLEDIYLHADYATINISSPNTTGLRQLQGKEYLAKLLEKVSITADNMRAKYQKDCPLLIKVSPDMSETEMRDCVKATNDSALAGIIGTNTTIHHPWQALMAGGMSGKPLAAKSFEALELIKSEARSDLVIISCGGIDGPAEMRRRIHAGADLVQLYTALVYQGAGLIKTLAGARI